MQKILIIEDEKHILLTLKMFFKAYNVEVIAAEDGIEGANLAFEYIPDMILLDILIPKMDGYMLCEILKKDIKTRHIPIIFMSAKNQQEDLKKAFDVGANDYLIKPFTMDDIKEVIKKYLEISRRG